MQPDLIRRLVVTGAGIVCAVGFVFGSGLFGDSVPESASGAFSADATLITPASTAFSWIWGTIYLGLIAYIIWQWLPAQKHSPRAVALSGWAALSLVLNAAWLAVSSFGWVWVSVVVILALAVVLKQALSALARIPSSPGTAGRVERVIVDGTFGLYLGWVAVAACANIAAALVASGAPDEGGLAEVTTIAVLLAVVGVGWWYLRRYGVHWPIIIGMAWGTAWIAVGRLTDEPSSVLVGIAAVLVTLALLGLAAKAQLDETGSRGQGPAAPSEDGAYGQGDPVAVPDEHGPTPA